MTKEVVERYVETYEEVEKCSPDKIMGIKSAKSFDTYVQSKITHFLRFPSVTYTGRDIELMFRTMLEAYKKFHPILKANVDIPIFKGTSGVTIVKYPTYFETTQYQKGDNKEIKQIKHKITKEQLNPLISAIEPLELNKKYKTRYVAQEYLKEAKIEADSEGRRFFDEKGFNFEMLVGNRDIYLPFWLCLKILEFYELIKYSKSGIIKKIKENMDIQTCFE